MQGVLMSPFSKNPLFLTPQDHSALESILKKTKLTKGPQNLETMGNHQFSSRSGGIAILCVRGGAAVPPDFPPTSRHPPAHRGLGP